MKKYWLYVIAIFLGTVSFSLSQDFISSSFKIQHPILQPGGFSSSNNFRSFGALSQPAIGESSSCSSATSTVKGGFYYFAEPTAAAPDTTPTPTTFSQPGGGGPILDIFKKLFERVLGICKRSDLNCDRLVNVYDAGILFYWWDKPISKPNFASIIANALGLGRPSPDINSDKIVNIYDLSIMLADWDRE